MAATSSELAELLGFLASERPDMRTQAAAIVVGLSGDEEGRGLLVRARGPTHLAARLSDAVPAVSTAAVTALVNLCDEERAMEEMVAGGVVARVMEALRDEACGWKRLGVVLLANLSQIEAGADAIVQKGEAGLTGLHMRRLIQWFAAPVRPAAGGGGAGGAAAAAAAGATRSSGTGVEGDDADTFEYVGLVLQNLTQQAVARAILLEPERGILSVLKAQLRSRSVVRRRGVAGTLRNCLHETDEARVRYLLSPAVDMAVALLTPLAGPDTYTAEEREGMPAAFTTGGARRTREWDAVTRRAAVEGIQLLASSPAGRAYLRRIRAYAVLKAFHEWLEASEATPAPAAAAAGGDAKAPAAAGAMVGADSGEGDKKLSPDDEATVAAINRIVQQLFRDDEVSHTSEVKGGTVPPPAAAAGSRPPPRALEDAPRGSASGSAGVGASSTGGGAAAAAAAAAGGFKATTPTLEEHMARYGVKVVPAEEARRRAAEVSAGTAELNDALVTVAPDWTEDDPDLPPAFAATLAASRAAAAAAASDTPAAAATASEAPAPAAEAPAPVPAPPPSAEAVAAATTEFDGVD